MISNTQNLILYLIEYASFNDFDGRIVTNDLRQHEHLWDAVTMQRDYAPLITLRDLPHDDFNVDCLYIITDEKRYHELQNIGLTWSPDDIDVIKGNEAKKLIGGCNPVLHPVLLRFWWD